MKTIGKETEFCKRHKLKLVVTIEAKSVCLFLDELIGSIEEEYHGTCFLQQSFNCLVQNQGKCQVKTKDKSKGSKIK